jgi:O-Antigen ligase
VLSAEPLSGNSSESTAARLYAALFGGMLFGFPIVALVPVVLHRASTPISAGYRLIIAFLSLSLLAIAAKEGRPFIDRLARRCVGVLALLLLLRMIWDSTLAPLPMDLPWSFYWAQVLGITAIPSLAFLVVPEVTWFHQAHRVCFWLGLLAAVSIVLGVALSVAALLHGERLATKVVNPITVGEVGASMYVVASTFVVRGHLVIKIARIIAIWLGVTLCVLSASKGPLLQLIVVLLIQFAVPSGSTTRSRRWGAALVMVSVLALGVVASIWFSGGQGLVLISRLADFASQQSTVDRLIAWRGALTQFNSSPFLGDSFVEYHLMQYPHNDFLESMMTVGITGLVLLTLLVTSGFVNALRRLREPYLRWIALLFIQQMLVEQTSGSLYFSQPFWILLLVVISFGDIRGGLAFQDRTNIASPLS